MADSLVLGVSARLDRVGRARLLPRLSLACGAGRDPRSLQPPRHEPNPRKSTI